MGAKDWVEVDGYEARFVAPQGIVVNFAPQAGAVPASVRKLEGRKLADCTELKGPIGDAAREEMRKHARPRHPLAQGERLDRPNAVLEVLKVTTTIKA